METGFGIGYGVIQLVEGMAGCCAAGTRLERGVVGSGFLSQVISFSNSVLKLRLRLVPELVKATRLAMLPQAQP